jgi:hypothetical protein
MKKRRRIAFVPRIAVGTVMIAVVPACVATACSSDDSASSTDGGADAGTDAYVPTGAFDMCACYDDRFQSFDVAASDSYGPFDASTSDVDASIVDGEAGLTDAPVDAPSADDGDDGQADDGG